MAGVSLAAASFVVATGCSGVYRAGAHDLSPTKGEVKFSTSSKAFFKGQWKNVYPASRKRLCAGFVHDENFKRYLEYGHFYLVMKLEVYKGGAGKTSGERILDWEGGRKLRTLVKKKPIRASQNSYVWCGNLKGGAKWKVGGMRFTFTLKRDTPPKTVPLAQGIVQIVR